MSAEHKMLNVKNECHPFPLDKVSYSSFVGLQLEHRSEVPLFKVLFSETFVLKSKEQTIQTVWYLLKLCFFWDHIYELSSKHVKLEVTLEIFNFFHLESILLDVTGI